MEGKLTEHTVILQNKLKNTAAVKMYKHLQNRMLRNETVTLLTQKKHSQRCYDRFWKLLSLNRGCFRDCAPAPSSGRAAQWPACVPRPAACDEEVAAKHTPRLRVHFSLLS